jgi:hypothetical protein
MMWTVTKSTDACIIKLYIIHHSPGVGYHLVTPPSTTISLPVQ